MNRNVGRIDRLIRIIVGLAILSLVVIGPQTAWALLGAIPLVTGLIGYCPLYSLFGFNTLGQHKETEIFEHATDPGRTDVVL